jgi:Holliday junction resolvasome RuvABC endonuclease subunit
VGEIIKNKRGVEAEILSEKKIINENGKSETWYDIMLIEKKKIISVKKIQVTKGSWTTRPISKEKKEEQKQKKREKAKNISIELPIEDKYTGTLLAIDQSTKRAGFSILDFSEKMPVMDYGVFKESEEDFIKRTIKIIKEIENKIEQHNVKAIAIEGIYLDTSGFKTMIASRAKTFEVLAYLKNRIIEIAIVKDLPIIVVPAVSWKKDFNITGTREEQKAKSIAEIKRLTGEELIDDVTDSLLIGKHTIIKRITFKGA